ncbi:putative chromosome-partitioning protein ParB [Tepidimonas alkaliphilus]|uniref:Putative chromosome-partitioning protein ParB n=1 Tax=Tepidimonas alkaliphilus TaxID=2588942 RepID=A0A554W7T4_9BURK|nr:ParB/RepB/Spo0J family partition protein [Tepidimonas alkaliphilus]TSE19631.1 putative chromosome-partitioning protein ParB [Tepidimonas alkaliphilus]
MKLNRKPKGLGRGLDALLGPSVSEPGPDAPRELPLSDLVPGPYQPRTRMDEGALYELAESIRAQGIMQPVLVRRLPEDVGEARLQAWHASPAGQPFAPAAPRGARPVYEIIAGERRFRAARLAGLEAVPVLVRDVADEAAAAMALIENIQREDLNPLEQAQGLQRLIRDFGLTHEQAAQAIGRSRSAATNLLRLLQLAEPVQAMLLAGDLDMGHARALLSLDKATQITAAHTIAAKGLSVREAEALARRLGVPAAPKPRQAREPDPDVRRLQDELSDLLAARVEVRVHKRLKRGGRFDQQGELAIAFSSLDELDGLLQRLRALAG